ncbi:phospholipase A2-like isoform X2 [Brienomyrus brachyistius]|uniref:phospholipase A2-like isoform X2 n=1 Tax=Brienomyrus brachyistius TaxID=42636 RepID=UPI0020B39584|nr:phospholipase A2-like isoform X2 [Brienomyrus brachyistius]
MKTLQTLFLLTTSLSIAAGLCWTTQTTAVTVEREALGHPWMTWTELHSSGLILCLCRCCQTHDDCYSQAKRLGGCLSILDNPYTESYSYSCDNTNKIITCTGKNNACEMFICECDKHAAMCFAGAGYNKEHQNMNQELCK